MVHRPENPPPTLRTARPSGHRTVENLKIQIRRLVERALGDLDEDTQAFGIE